MKIYGCQFDIAWEDKAANFAKVRGLLKTVQPSAGAMIVLPEMFATGFSMNVAAISEEPIVGPTGRFLSECAAEWGAYLLGGFVTIGPEGKGRNMLGVFAPDGTCAARYAKIHPFSFGEESRHYRGGTDICQVNWRGLTARNENVESGSTSTRVSPFICYDLRFPEVLRMATLGGAEVLVIIANWPQPRASHWRLLLQARAIENQAYVVGINRCGRDPKNAYAGGSLIIDPRGPILADAGDSEQVISSDLDLNMLRTYRADFPALQDAHIELISPMAMTLRSDDDEPADYPLK